MQSQWLIWSDKNENVEDSNFMMLHHYKAIINLWEISLVFQAHWNFEF